MAQQTDRTIQFQGAAQVTLRAIVLLLIALAVVTFIYTNNQIMDIRFEIATRHFHAALSTLGLSSTFYVLWLPGLQAVTLFLDVIIALVILSRRSSEPVALLMAIALVTFSAVNFHHNDLISQRMPVLTLAQALNILIALTTVSAIIYLFPDGRPYPRRVIWLAFPQLLINCAAAGYILISQTSSAGAHPVFFATLLMYAIGLVAQGMRYQRVLKPIQRQQVKWVLGGIAISQFTITLYFLIFALVTPNLPEYSTQRLLLDLIIDDGLHFFGLIVLALAMMNAILRRQLWDIDFAINRALGIIATVVLLGIVLSFAAALISRVVPTEVAILASLAIGVGLFLPTRQVLQRVIDMHLYGLRAPVEAYEPITPTKTKPPVSKPGLFTGKTLDGIELHDLIARGGMGEVYKGYVGDNVYAVKLLPTEHNDEAEMRFGQEAEAMRRIQHPNIVRLERFGSAEGIRYLAMEYVEGMTLRTYILRRQRVPLEVVYSVISDLANALDHVHELGIVHRDLKPGNIMLNLDSAGMPVRTVLLDFGIARIVEMSVTQTDMGSLGTIEYIAPEQILSSKTVTRAADIYALGVIVYEMLTGERPFKGNPGQMLFSHLKQPAPDPRDLVRDLPMEVSFAIRRAMAKEPYDRYATAHEFAEALYDTESATSASIRFY